MPLFSIILPIYNKEKFIAQTLHSILKQTIPDFELIIVNDGSTDSSAEIVSKFKDSRIRYYFKENEGVSSARNYGLKLATAEHIAFIDADDYWYPDFLFQINENIKQYHTHKVFSTAIEIETVKVVLPAVYSIEKTGNCELVNFFDASQKEAVLWTSSSVFHRIVFEKVGKFDVTIKSGQDTDMWIRIGLEYPVVFCWKILARYVYDKNSLLKDKTIIMQRLNFAKFEVQEKTNAKLKKFLDLNRYAQALRLKINGNKEHFSLLYKQIDLNNIQYSRRILLLLPPICLRFLVAVKQILENMGICKTVFK